MGAQFWVSRGRHNEHENWPWGRNGPGGITADGTAPRAIDDVPYIVEPAYLGPWRCKGHPERFTKETCGTCVEPPSVQPLLRRERRRKGSRC